jgi:glycosyltransferase involved in cell wall biosynthesis
MQNGPLVSISIPVYNEEKLVESSVRTLVHFLRESSFPYPYTIVIVDNGSVDATLACGARLEETFPGVVSVLSLAEKGKGRAIREGWKKPGDVLAFMDVDLSSDLGSFRTLIDAVVVDGNAIAVGNRLGKNSRIYGRRLVREMVSWAYNFLVRSVFHSNLPDHQCGFKAIRREAYERLSPKIEETGWFFDTELLVLAQRQRYTICSVDIHWTDNRESKVSLGRTSREMFASMLAFRRRLEESY